MGEDERGFLGRGRGRGGERRGERWVGMSLNEMIRGDIDGTWVWRVIFFLGVLGKMEMKMIYRSLWSRYIEKESWLNEYNNNMITFIQKYLSTVPWNHLKAVSTNPLSHSLHTQKNIPSAMIKQTFLPIWTTFPLNKEFYRHDLFIFSINIYIPDIVWSLLYLPSLPFPPLSAILKRKERQLTSHPSLKTSNKSQIEARSRKKKTTPEEQTPN